MMMQHARPKVRQHATVLDTLVLARELHPEGICYFSEDSHYSVAKVLRLQHTRNIMLKSQPNGEMDYDDLRETLRIHHHHYHDVLLHDFIEALSARRPQPAVRHIPADVRPTPQPFQLD